VYFGDSTCYIFDVEVSLVFRIQLFAVLFFLVLGYKEFKIKQIFGRQVIDFVVIL
jgi:hypothetical protein